MDMVINDTLIGVLAGALIPLAGQIIFYFQSKKAEQQRFERDVKKENREKKVEAYNEIIFNDVDKHIIDWEHVKGGEMDIRLYIEHIRPLFYKIYHLLDMKIIKEIERIDTTLDELRVEGHVHPDDYKAVTSSYKEIIKLIKEDIKQNKH